MRSLITTLILPIILLTLGACGCPVREGGGTVRGSQAAALDSVSSIRLDRDSARIWIGTEGKSFYSYDLRHGTLERYYLPAEARGGKIYDVLRTADSAFLVAVRNQALYYLEYDGQRGGSAHEPAGYSQISLPPMAAPDKREHISIYHLMDCDSLILAGGSNGLASLPRPKPGSAKGDTIYLRPAAALEHLRRGHKQFAQEGLENDGDAIIAATDRGLYRIGKQSLNDPKGAELIEDGRYWRTRTHGDSIYALRSDGHGGKEIMTYSRTTGKPGKARGTAPWAMDMTVSGDSITALGPQSRFAPAEYSVPNGVLTAGGDLYYISGGKLLRLNQKAGANGSDEQIRFDMGRYVISDKGGLWSKTEEGYEFTGQITGCPHIVQAAASPRGEEIYMAAADGVYKAGTGRFIWPSDRNAVRIIEVASGDNDRIESVLPLDDGQLLVGSRNSLSLYDAGGKPLKKYVFMADRERGITLDSLCESPYVREITSGMHDGYLINTLNFGMWRLASADDTALYQTGIYMPHPGGRAELLPARPGLTWAAIGEKAGWLASIVCMALTLFGIILLAVRARHRRQLRNAKKIALSEYDRLADLIRQTAEDSRKNGYEAFAMRLRPAYTSLQRFLDDPDNMAARREAEDAAHRLNRFCRDRVTAEVKALSATLPETMPEEGEPNIYAAMRRLRERVTKYDDGSEGDNLSLNLRTAGNMYAAYRKFIDRLLFLLRVMRGEEDRRRVFTTEYMELLWRAIVTLDTHNVRSVKDYSLFHTETGEYGRGNKKYEKVNVGRVTFAALVFHNNAKPKILNVEPLSSQGRSFYEFHPQSYSNSNNHGSVYKMIAMAMSRELALREEMPVVHRRVADILWEYYFSRCHNDIIGLRGEPGQEKSLSAAIMAATVIIKEREKRGEEAG